MRDADSGRPAHKAEAGHGVGESGLLSGVRGLVALAQQSDFVSALLVGDAAVGEVAGDLSGEQQAAQSDVVLSSEIRASRRTISSSLVSCASA